MFLLKKQQFDGRIFLLCAKLSVIYIVNYLFYYALGHIYAIFIAIKFYQNSALVTDHSRKVNSRCLLSNCQILHSCCFSGKDF